MISIHALREEGDTTRLSSAESKKEISIHALREEGDPVRNELYHHHQHFYPRPPRGGRRSSSAWQAIRAQFLSTPSARRATPDRHPGCHDHCISIHALREEGDYPTLMARIRSEILSTPSARRATRHKRYDRS